MSCDNMLKLNTRWKKWKFKDIKIFLYALSYNYIDNILDVKSVIKFE